MISKYILSDIPEFMGMITSNNINNSNILKLNKIECRTANNIPFKVIRYDKNFLTSDLFSSYGLFRSVIVNNDKVVGFAPPKSLNCEHFIKKYPEITKEIVAEEFVEGTMINVFWDQTIGLTGGWELSTRNTVGATSTFYKGTKSQTFRDMFLEAAKNNNLVLDTLEKDKCYSFVLQHPNNRIVVPFNKPQLYIVALYSINHNKNQIIVNSYDVQEYKHFFHDVIKTSIQFPELYKFNNYSELVEKYGSMNTPYNIVGVILHNKITGERTKVRNPVYEQVRHLRGNQPKLQYQYLCLRSEGKVKDYLTYYPEHKSDFSSYRDQVHLFTDTLFSNYISCYIKKEKPLLEFSDQYRTHMFNIHQKYLHELKDKKQFVTNTVVQKYVNSLHPSLLMYCLNYNMRVRNIDIVKTDM